MRSSALLTAAFAVGVLSAPLADKKRDLVIDTVVDVVMVTDYETVTAGATSAATSVAEAATTSPVQHYGHHHSWTWQPESSAVASTTTEASSTSVVPVTTAPATTSSISVAPTTSVVEVASTTESSATTAAASTSAASVSTAEASSTTAAAASKATSYQQLVVAHHNVHRANHSASDIAWDAGLASTALSIAKTCVYEHNVTANGGGYGQNIAAGVESAQIGTVISDLFYNGEVNYYAGLYGQASPDMSNFEHWGHFSQIVWKATSKVGCATYDCSSSGLANVASDVSPYFTVCNYESPGNYAGEYTNVGDSLNRASVYGTSTLDV